MRVQYRSRILCKFQQNKKRCTYLLFSNIKMIKKMAKQLLKYLRIWTLIKFQLSISIHYVLIFKFFKLNYTRLLYYSSSTTTLSNFSLVSVYLNVFWRENKDLIFEKKNLNITKVKFDKDYLTLKLKSANTYRAHHLITLHV